MKKKVFSRFITLIAIFLCVLSSNAGFLVKNNNAISNATLTSNIKEIDKSTNFIKQPIKDKISFDKLEGIELPNGLKPAIKPEGSTVPLPEEYCMRDDYILYAKHQDKLGLCWNFASTMAASTTIMKATNEYYDFSELWTAITCYTPKKTYSKIGAGGNFSYQYKAMQRSGLMLESDLPYQLSYVISNENANDYYNFYNKYSNDDLSSSLISDSDTTYNRSDVEDIKKHIINNGSLYLAFTFKTGFEEDENGVFALEPNQKNGSGNHAVSLIGWDDNYEKTFTINSETGETKTFKGAWIILNSYTETNGTDGISLIFYEDTNIYSIKGYRYVKNTDTNFYFYDKIESGYEYPTNVKGKYYGDLLAETAPTKQLNIFYDDVNLEYSYEISNGASIKNIEIYLDNKLVTNEFTVTIDENTNRFFIKKDDAEYGNYKILVNYGNQQTTDTHLNNFFVTHGLVGEELEFDYSNNSLAFNTGKDFEYFSFNSSYKNQVIYTNSLSGSVSFIASPQSVYSEKDMALPTISYEITDGNSCVVTHTITANNGYELKYSFTFIYCEDTTMQPVRVYYDLNGGVNNNKNFTTELSNETNSLVLYEPTREGYDFVGWYINGEEGEISAVKDGDKYLIDWSNIIHMGENPTLYATSYYKEYYNNTNALFVRAVWKEAEKTVPNQHVNDVLVGLIIAVSSVAMISTSALVILLIKMSKVRSAKLSTITIENEELKN